MLYRILADLTAVFHFLFILFIVFGGLLVFYRKWIAWVHIPAGLWGVLIELFGWYCPLTPLENSLRLSADQQGYQGGFVQHYLLPLIYPGELTRGIQIVLGFLVFVFNAVVYGILLGRIKKKS